MKKNKKNTKNEVLLKKETVISSLTRKDIEKSYNLDNFNGTEAYFSNRYGWTLRKTLD